MLNNSIGIGIYILFTNTLDEKIFGAWLTFARESFFLNLLSSLTSKCA